MDFLGLNLDPETVRAIIAVQLADLNEIESQHKGKQPMGRAAEDNEIAIKTLRQDLEHTDRFLSDRLMCLSINNAIQQDSAIIASEQRKERIAKRDRRYATRLQNGDETSVASEISEEESGDDVPPPYSMHVKPKTVAGSSADAPQQRDDGPRQSCVSCISEYPESHLLRSTCGHLYCRDCIRTLFTMSFQDESLFPPRCCQREIPSDSVRNKMLNDDMRRTYIQKQVEFGTHNRTYCHEPQCGAFIPHHRIIGDTATCSCRRRTCAICKQAAHNGDCPQDEAAKAVRELAQQEGWQECGQCHRLVELNMGCYHMTCLCRYEFCYLCGLRWKSCRCPQWDEGRLLNRANVVVNRQPLRRGVNMEEAVAAMVHQLDVNHECTHRTWRILRGSHRCEQCHDTMPEFIFTCSQCQLMVCKRCRYNRQL